MGVAVSCSQTHDSLQTSERTSQHELQDLILNTDAFLEGELNDNEFTQILTPFFVNSSTTTRATIDSQMLSGLIELNETDYPEYVKEIEKAFGKPVSSVMLELENGTSNYKQLLAKVESLQTRGTISNDIAAWLTVSIKTIESVHDKDSITMWGGGDCQRQYDKATRRCRRNYILWGGLSIIGGAASPIAGGIALIGATADFLNCNSDAQEDYNDCIK